MEGLRDYQEGFLRELGAAGARRTWSRGLSATTCAGSPATPSWRASSSTGTSRRSARRRRSRWRSSTGGFWTEAGTLLEPHFESGALRRLPLDLFNSALIGPSQEFARHWLAGRTKTSIKTAERELAEAAWRALSGAQRRLNMATTYAEAIEEARATDDQLVVVEREGAHAIVRMDDPDKLNPLSAELTVQLHDALRELARDEELQAIVLTGTDPAFSAGGDLRLMQNMAHPMVDEGEGGATSIWRWIRMEFGGIARLITRTDKAFIAAVNGAAAGVGLAFALACDLILASERARIVPAFGKIGLVPEVGTSWLLTRRLGYQRTFELFAEGRVLSGGEAHAIGLANSVHPHEELLPAALEWCERVEGLPPHVVPMMKPLLRGAADATWDQAIAMEEFAEPMTLHDAAHREAVAGLLSKSV